MMNHSLIINGGLALTMRLSPCFVVPALYDVDVMMKVRGQPLVESRMCVKIQKEDTLYLQYCTQAPIQMQ